MISIHLICIIDKYLYPTWIKDGLLKRGKLVQTNILNKQIENMLFFPSPMTLHDTSLRTASSMNFLKISNSSTKHFYFYCYLDRERYVPKSSWRLFFISSSYPLQGLTPFTTYSFYSSHASFWICMSMYMCIYVYAHKSIYNFLASSLSLWIVSHLRFLWGREKNN